MLNISQIQVDRVTYNVCDTFLRDLVDWQSKHQWNVYETDDGSNNNITKRNLPAKTMNSSNHPYTSYQNYTIFEERKYNLTEADHYGILLCNSVQFLSGNSASGSANTLASAVFEGEDSGDSSFTFSTTTSPTRYQLQYMDSGLTQRDHWVHFEQLDYGNYYCYHYGMMSSVAKSLTDKASNYIRIRGWILTQGIVTVGKYGSVFYGESFDDQYGTKTITIDS